MFFDLNKLINFYKSKGFFDVKINYNISESTANTFLLSFFINEGVRVKINDITFDKENPLFDKNFYDFKEIFFNKLNNL